MRNGGDWTLTQHAAEWSRSRFAVRVNLERPDGGLQVEIDGRTIDGTMLQLRRMSSAGMVDAQWDLEDFYVRREDLVAVYRPADDWPFRLQVYWRTRAPRDVDPPCLELIVSVQTDLLDTEPLVTIGSSLPSASLIPLACDGPGGFLLRFSESASYAEMVHPADFIESHCTEFATEHVLFRRHLEKGVILRSRLIAAWLPREGDMRAAAELQSRFAAEPPPLTT